MFHRVYASVPGADEEFEARKKKFCEENSKEEKDIRRSWTSWAKTSTRFPSPRFRNDFLK